MMPHRMAGVLSLLLVLALEMRAQGEVVLSVGGEPVKRSEFEYYFRKSSHRTPASFLPSFIDYKLKVRHARDMGMDTLSVFRRQTDRYRDKLLRILAAEKEERAARRSYLQSGQRLQANDWIKMAHISNYVSQHADRREEMRARQQMDSVYEALRKGADFATLARRYSDDETCKNEGGVLPWMPVNRNMQEWIDKLASLERNEISTPFYSPMGIHIVKWTDRRPGIGLEEKREGLSDHPEKNGNRAREELSAGQKENRELRMQELHDGLLAAYWSLKYQSGDESREESDLERFFEQHKSAYAWDLPHYRGAVIHCKDKRAASVIKKQLKKKPVSRWKDILQTLTGDAAFPRVRMETGVFRIGTNKYIDKLVFKCGGFQPEPDLPYTFVMGKKLKKGPESYEDVREAVVRDCLAAREAARMEDLKRKYKVEINQEVLKTVNNNGSD